MQRRIQRYGWDLAAARYDALWQAQLEPAQTALLAAAALQPGERVLDLACGTGQVTRAAATFVGAGGEVLGIDLSQQMIERAKRPPAAPLRSNVRYLRMDAEELELADGGFDVALCALGLMYMPQPEQALRRIHQVLRPDGRIALAVWGERSRCGWADLFSIVDARVASDVCPLFFRLGQGDALARICEQAGFPQVTQQRIASVLVYDSPEQACHAAFVGGPVALAWSRFDAATQARVCDEYLASIARWRHGDGYRVPAEFVVVAAARQGLSPGAGGANVARAGKPLLVAGAKHPADGVAAETPGGQEA